MLCSSGAHGNGRCNLTGCAAVKDIPQTAMLCSSGAHGNGRCNLTGCAAVTAIPFGLYTGNFTHLHFAKQWTRTLQELSIQA
jgi:hypothetical protein